MVLEEILRGFLCRAEEVTQAVITLRMDDQGVSGITGVTAESCGGVVGPVPLKICDGTTTLMYSTLLMYSAFFMWLINRDVDL